jgi:hypothetical protein
MCARYGYRLVVPENEKAREYIIMDVKGGQYQML